LLPIDAFEVEDGHDLLSQVVIVDVFNNVLSNAGDLRHLEDVRALVVVFVKKRGDKHFQAGVYALGERLQGGFYDFLKDAVDGVGIEGFLECN